MRSWFRIVSHPHLGPGTVEVQLPAPIVPPPVAASGSERDPEALLAEVEAEAGRILEEARAAADGIRAAAEAAGRADGLEQGLQAGQAQVRAALEMALRLADAARHDKEELLREAEAAMVGLVMEVARKVIGRELTADPATVEALVRAAVRGANGGERIVIRLHPQDLELLQGFWEPLQATGTYAHWEVVADQRIQRGGCIVDTESGSVDAQVDTQLAEIHRVFLSLAEQ